MACVDFDGSENMYDSSSDSGSLDITGPMTIAAWIQPDSEDGTIVGRRDINGTQLQYQLYIQSSDLVFATTSAGAAGDRVANAVTVDGSTMTHVAATLDSDGDVDLFTNGTNIGNFANSRTITSYSIDTAVGSRWSTAPTVGFAYNGRIGEVHIYDRQLSEAEIQEIMYKPGTIVDNLVAYWPMYGSSFTTDLSGSGNDLDSSVGTPSDSNVGFPVYLPQTNYGA